MWFVPLQKSDKIPSIKNKEKNRCNRWHHFCDFVTRVLLEKEKSMNEIFDRLTNNTKRPTKAHVADSMLFQNYTDENKTNISLQEDCINLFIKFKHIILFLCLFSPISAIAGGTYHMTVGETKVLEFSTTKDIRTSNWVSNSTNIQITSSGQKYAFIKAVKSWTASSPLIVRCDYYYTVRSGSFSYTGIGAEDFRIYINPINPTNVSISSSKTLNIGGTVTLTPTLTPINAETEYTWSSSNTSIVTVSSAGLVRAIDAGSADITVKTKNGLTAVSEITVPQPVFSLVSITPVNNAQNVSINTPIYTLFSLPLFQGSLFSSITLSNKDKGAQVSGSVSISGKKLTFTPSQSLDPNTKYKLIIPVGALKNQWGTSYSSVVENTFKTGTLDILSSTPTNNADKVSVKQKISIEYNTEILAGQDYDGIQLQEVATDSIVPCTKKINGNKLLINPSVNLKHLIKYKVVIPINSLTNKDSIAHARRDSVFFTTIDKLVLTANPSGGMIASGGSVQLVARVADAKIFYTLNGKQPTNKNTAYTESITIDTSLTLKAIAYKDGYEESEIFVADYRALKLKVVSSSLEDNAKYVRNDISLSYSFNEAIRKGGLFDSIALLKRGRIPVTSKKIISGKTLFLVPEEPLDSGEIFQVVIPLGAVENHLAEPNIAFSQRFTTGLVYTAVSAGRNFTMALKSDATLWAWGANAIGQLGDSTTISKKTPVKILDDVVAVSANGYHTMAIKSDGSLWGWGCNYYGQLGNGSTKNSLSPIKIMDDVVMVSADSSRTLVIKSDSSLWAWGSNADGRLGDGTLVTKTTPVKIMDDVISVSTGGYHTMAIKSDGTLWAWGLNNAGRLGDGTTINRLLPVKILDSVTSVSAGNWHTMAIKTDGTLWAWGLNNSGRLGDGTTVNRIAPVKVLDSILAVSAGGEHTLALKANHSLWAWGGNGSSQLGNGTTTSKSSPVKIMDNISVVSAGWDQSMAIKSDGTLWAWGANGSSQLGDGTSTNKASPVQVLTNNISLAPITAITLDKNKLELLTGRTSVLIANLEPFNADYNSIQWSSDNDAVVSVSQKGILTAIAPGLAKVTVTASKNEGESYSVECEVVVSPIPVLTGKIGISGDFVYGQILTADTSGLTTDPVENNYGELSFQWTRDGIPIPGESAQKSTYKLTTNDLGKNIGVSVTAMDCNGGISSNVKDSVSKASFDMSGILFENQKVTQDGQPHSILIRGSIPTGVFISEYIGNGQTLEGIYTVKVKFSVADSINYNVPVDMNAVLTIEKNKTAPLIHKELATSNSNIYAWIQGDELHIKGLAVGRPWFAYTVAGKRVHEGVSQNSEETLVLPNRGIYIIKSNNKAIKVAF